MAKTYEPIATTTLGSGSSTISFSSIPNTYTDLRVIMTVNSSGLALMALRFNSDSATNYSQTVNSSTGGAVSNWNEINQTAINLAGQIGLANTYPDFFDINVFNYAGSTNKTVIYKYSSNRNSVGYLDTGGGLWRSTSAITTVTFSLGSGTFTSGGIATLYGIKAA